VNIIVLIHLHIQNLRFPRNYGPVCLAVLETVFCFQNSETCFGPID
jgi:hypothetical protein